MLESPSDSPRVTELQGTQPQSKLGQLIDTSMTAQFLARILPTLGEGDPLQHQVNGALDVCITKLSRSQQSDGSWLCNVGPGDAFATAVSTLILQIPYQYLPIFQR